MQPRVKDKIGAADVSFHRPAILGATPFGAQVAALFANVGIRVRLYDKPHADEPNYFAQQAIAALNHMRPSPLGGAEVSAWIEARNFRDHWSLLSEHDLLIECLPDQIALKQGLWSRIAPALARDSVVLSHSAGLSISEISNALTPALRARFMGVHFFRPPRYQHLVELIPYRNSDVRLLHKLRAYFTEYFGCAVIEAPDTPNYISTRLIYGLINIAFYHYQAFGLSLAAFEALTQMMIGRSLGGLCHLLDHIGLDRLRDCQLEADEEALFGDMLHPPTLFQTMLAAKRSGREVMHGFYDYHYKPYLLSDAQGRSCPSFRIDMALRMAFIRHDWAALCAAQDQYGQFVHALLRDWWQYAAYLARATNLPPEQLDTILARGFSWQTGLYGLVQEFGVAAVEQSTRADAAAGRITYPLQALWPQQRLQATRKAQPSNPFVSQARLLAEHERSATWIYRDGLLVWQPRNERVALDDVLLHELLNACSYARRAELYLLIYHHGLTFGGINDLQHLQHSATRRDRYHHLLRELLMALRTHPCAVMASLCGTLGDVGMAILMQADQLLLDIDLHWKLYAPMSGLPPLGGVWFEWLRRLPYLSREHYLEQVHAILCRVVTLQQPGDAHSSRTVGILRVHDRVISSRKALVQATVALADAWLDTRQPRTPRQAQYQLAPHDVAILANRAGASSQPELYLDLLDLLTGQKQNMTVSLRMLLEQEHTLLARLQAQRGQSQHQ